MKIKRVISTMTAAMILSCTPTFSSAAIDTAFAQSDSVTYSIDKDTPELKGIDDNGFSYDVFLELYPNTTGAPHGSMTVGDDGGLLVEWDDRTPSTWFEADYGYKYDPGTKAMEQGKISIDYDAEHSAGEEGNSRIGVHGWLSDPVVEFYVIDNWVNWCPNNANSKTVVIDGGEYDVFKLVHYGGDIMASSSVFTQYFSVRKTPRTSGTITVSDHFKAWESLGWKMGDLRSVNFNVAGWESSGSANVKNLKINAPKPVTTTTTTTTETTTSTTTTSSATQESTTTTSATTTTDILAGDDKKYTEVVNTVDGGRGEIIPPYIFYSDTKNGHMYAAENGCFAASTDASEVSRFSAGIKQPEDLQQYHIIGPKSKVTADYKFENNYRYNRY